MITRNEVHTLLTQDYYYRKIGKWPLITCNKTINTKVRDIVDMFHLKSHLRYGNSYFYPIDILENSYPFVIELLMKFKGVVAAGGAITRAFSETENWFANDVDLFLYGMSVAEAQQTRNAIILYLVDRFRNEPFSIVKKCALKSYNILRNTYATSIYFQVEVERGYGPNAHREIDTYIYQIVHRIYPDQSSVIGGFDIGPCMTLFDGYDFKCTPLGYWTLQNNALIIDTKRRSTSFESRIVKYFKRGFSIIFPGLATDIYDKTVMKEVRDLYSELKEYELEAFIKNIYKYNYGSIKFWKYQQEHELLPYLYINPFNRVHKVKNKNFYAKKQTYVETKVTSDYSHNTLEYIPNIGRVNATRLRLGDLDAVVSFIDGEKVSDLATALQDDMKNPNIGFTEEVLKYYTENLKYFNDSRGIYGTINRLRNTNNNSLERTLVNYFGTHAEENINNNYQVTADLKELMLKKMSKNAELCIENLKEVSWLTKNPGRQWTASFNPIFEDPRQWYGKHYLPVIVGIPPEIETTLRLIYKRKLKNVPLDVFKLILLYLCRAYAMDAWQHI